jgi:inner membrane protein
MYVFGHLGLTLGLAVVGASLYDLVCQDRSPTRDGGHQVPGEHRDGSRKSFGLTWNRLNKWLDVRLLLIGSVFPDLVDKPLGYVYLNSGRTVSHTLLFALLSLFPLMVVRKPRERRWLLALSIGLFAHLGFDQMWREPSVLFWPLLGVEFAPFPKAGWLHHWVASLSHAASAYVPELIGLSVVLAFSVFLIRSKKVREFIFKGLF